MRIEKNGYILLFCPDDKGDADILTPDDRIINCCSSDDFIPALHNMFADPTAEGDEAGRP